MNKPSILALCFTILPHFAARQLLAAASAPDVLNFAELVTLSETNQPATPLEEKLDRLLRTPFLNNDSAAVGGQPHRPFVAGIGPVLRVADWNIERGLNLDLIKLALSDPDGFQQAALESGGPDPKKSDAGKQAKIERQLRVLRDADIILLNEVDLGMKRTDYRDVTRDLAHALGMNYAFGVEFVEVDRLDDLGLEKVQLEDQPFAVFEVRDRSYLGLHGNAILSRYPIQNVRIFRLPVCHDWFKTEKAAISNLEKGKRLTANKVFLERIEREVRQGGRMAIIADVRIPDVPGGVATVVNVHLENKCKPECRTKQMDALLARIKEVEKPVIVAGNLNTSGTDGTPTSIRREILNRVKNYEFWITQALKWGTPASLPLAVLTPVKYFKNYLDPTSRHVPFIGNNKEAILFRHVEKFRFVDRRAFDFRGENRGTLANSNQRAVKGFEPTYTLRRDFGGLVGRYKLDWFFVKPFIPRPRDEGMSDEFAPHSPMTMRDLNNAVPDGISDHAPITVDLPLGAVTAADAPVGLRSF